METTAVIAAAAATAAEVLGVPSNAVRGVPVYGSDTWSYRLRRSDHRGGVCVCRKGDPSTAQIQTMYKQLMKQHPELIVEGRFNDVFLVDDTGAQNPPEVTPPEVSSTAFRRTL